MLCVLVFVFLCGCVCLVGCVNVCVYWVFFILLTLQRGVTGTARMLHALTHSSISRQVREQM